MEHGLLFYVVLNFPFKDLVVLCESLYPVFVNLHLELHTRENLLGGDLEVLKLLDNSLMAFFLRQTSQLIV